MVCRLPTFCQNEFTTRAVKTSGFPAANRSKNTFNFNFFKCSNDISICVLNKTKVLKLPSCMAGSIAALFLLCQQRRHSKHLVMPAAASNLSQEAQSFRSCKQPCICHEITLVAWLPIHCGCVASPSKDLSFVAVGNAQHREQSRVGKQQQGGKTAAHSRSLIDIASRYHRYCSACGGAGRGQTTFLVVLELNFAKV